MTGALLSGASEFTAAQSTTLDTGIAWPDALDAIMKSLPTQSESSVTDPKQSLDWREVGMHY